MQEREKNIREAIGQLERSIDIAQKYMDNETFSVYCDNIYASISKLRAAIQT